jgi:O-antigen ligase
MLLSFMLPLELETPWIQFKSLDVTNLEICLSVVLILTFVRWIYEGRPSLRLPRIWLLLGALFLATLFISSFAAPAYRDNALTAAMRTLSGIALMLATIIIVRSKRDLTYIAIALVAGALMAAMVGLAEISHGDEYIWLRSFRSSTSVAGVFLRLSGPFDYANQAAMFIEAALPLIVALFLIAWRNQRKVLAAALGLGALLLTQAALSTYSRSAMVIVIVFLLLLLVGTIWLRRRAPNRNYMVLSLLTIGALLIVVVNVLVDPVWRMRFSSEGDAGWYRSEIHVPSELSLVAEQVEFVPVTLKNDGVFTWRSTGSSPVLLAARWVHPGSKSQLAEQPRWPLTRAIAPGESELMKVPLRAPKLTGEFNLVWDLVQEEVTWFGLKTGQETTTAVHVVGGNLSLDDGSKSLLESGELVAEWQTPSPDPGRVTLWKTAWNLWKERFLLGIGLDNFRLRYGEELGYELWNQTVHSNNWYVETVVSLGLLGALPFLAWLGALVFDLISRARNGGIWTIALAAAILAFLIHGFLDYFLLFNATGLLFWMLVGMWVALNYHIEFKEATNE